MIKSGFEDIYPFALRSTRSVRLEALMPFETRFALLRVSGYGDIYLFALLRANGMKSEVG
jgi:hypothetical protein